MSVRGLITIAFMALIVAPDAEAAAVARRGLTSRQMERLSPDARDRVVKRDLLSILQTPRKIRRGMRVEVAGAAISTTPVASGYAGLCRRDELIVWYRGSLGAPRVPYAVSATPRFRFLKSPSRAVAEGSAADTSNRRCARLDTGKEQPWFEAKDAGEAMEATLMLEKAASLVKDGKFQITDCDNEWITPHKTCQEIMAESTDLAGLIWVNSCDAKDGETCYALSLSGVEVSITAQYSSDAEAPGEIHSVKIAHYVVVT
ncbi:hypothetical protein BH10PSE14_BH10PSE14_44960 [soil metagenome]